MLCGFGFLIFITWNYNFYLLVTFINWTNNKYVFTFNFKILNNIILIFSIFFLSFQTIATFTYSAQIPPTISEYTPKRLNILMNCLYFVIIYIILVCLNSCITYTCAQILNIYDCWVPYWYTNVAFRLRHIVLLFGYFGLWSLFLSSIHSFLLFSSWTSILPATRTYMEKR